MISYWLAVDEAGSEWRYERKPYRDSDWCSGSWIAKGTSHSEKLPTGSIEELIGREMTWDDEPYELREETK